MGYSPDAATSTVLATLIFVFILGSIFTGLFEYLRGKYDDIYTSRLRSQGHRTLSPPPPEPFQWMWHVWMVSDEDFLQSVGMDGYIFLRYLRLCCKITAICGITGLIILVPVYFSCPGNDGVAGINLYTMANVEQRGHALWAPFIFTWMFTLLLLYLLYQEYGAFAHFRQLFLQHGDEDNLRPQTRYSVLVENIPVEYRSTEKLFAFFDNLFPNEIAHVCISVGMRPLVYVLEKRDEMVAKAELAIAEYEASGRTARPTIKLLKGVPVSSSCKCGPAAEEVDAMEYYESKIAVLNALVTKYQLEARNAENGDVLPPGTLVSNNDINSDTVNEQLDPATIADSKPRITKKSVSGTGFVTFKSRKAQTCACQVAMLSHKYPQMKVFPAPDPHDVLWSNVTTTSQYTKEVTGVVSIAYSVGILFWGLILAFIATISNITTLEEYLPFIKDMDPVLYGILAGVLPVYALVLVIYLIPKLMAGVSEYIERKKTKSSIEFEVFDWNFVYQLCNVYFLMLAGSIATAISDLIDDPESILTTLGTSLPSISVLLINYSLNVMFVQIPADMLRAPTIALFQGYKYLFAEKKLTRRQILEGPLEDEALDYGVALPKLLYLLVLAITYWVIAPILLGVISCTFLLSYLRWKYKMLYIYVPKYEAGGLIWYGMYKYTMYALVASTLTMIGYFGIKEGPAQGGLLLPLLYIIFRVWNFTEDCYKDTSTSFAYSHAVEADSSNGADIECATGLLGSFHADYYSQPFFYAPQVAQLQPYRIDGVSLWTNNGNFAPEYYKTNFKRNENDSGIQVSSNDQYSSNKYRSLNSKIPETTEVARVDTKRSDGGTVKKLKKYKSSSQSGLTGPLLDDEETL